MKKEDIDKIRAEIDSRKSEKGIVSQKLGESQNVGAVSRNSFLNELITSLETGTDTSSSNRIRMVENTVAQKNGETRSPISKQSIQPIRSDLHETGEIGMSPERDELLYRDMEKKSKQTLSEQLRNYSAPVPQYNQLPQSNNQPMQLNEEFLANSVNKLVGNYLGENLGVIIEEANKNVILELFAVERIKTVISENRKMIKEIVYETIREIQNKNKAK